MLDTSRKIERSSPRSRGRPRGIKHWTDFAQVRLYARMTHIIKRDRCDARTAARVWLRAGHVHVNVSARRYWTDRTTDLDRHQLSALVDLCKPGYARQETGDSIESVRVAYQKVKARYCRELERERYSHDYYSEFRASCDLWLRFERLHEQMGDPVAAFEAACNE